MSFESGDSSTRYPDGEYAWRLQGFDMRMDQHSFVCEIFSPFEERDPLYELGNVGWTGNMPLEEDIVTVS